MISSEYIKTALLSYLRFGKGAKVVATEAGRYSSDVLAIRKNELYEFEVKVSKSDLKADFKKGKHTHYRTPNLTEAQAKHVPVYFYFAVPPELAEYAIRSCLTTPYGIVVVTEGIVRKISEDWCFSSAFRKEREADIVAKGGVIISWRDREPPWNREGQGYLKHESDYQPAWNEKVKVIKRAKRLHKFTTSFYMIESMNARASSELANLRIKYYALKNKSAINS